MNTPDYTDLDKLITEAVANGFNTAAKMMATPDLKAAAGKHADAQSPDWRVVDRRLQAMRKKGAITFDKHGREWRPVAAS